MADRHFLEDRDPLVFAGSPLDRGDQLRRDETAIAGLADAPGSWWMALDDRGPLLNPDGALHWLSPQEARAAGLRAPFFLGHYRGSACMAARWPEAADLPHGASFVDARPAAMGLPHDEAAMFALARALFAWHDRHGHCANCGACTAIRAGGFRRRCPECAAEHFPRVDPVVIMLATDGEHCLLGRQSSWPERSWSALAGFVEPAETLEEACARELAEESGVRADPAGIRYVMSQPWPFPSSLMVGLVAPAQYTTIEVDPHELEAARWFSRDEVRAMLAGHHPDFDLPPSIAIARRLAELWADEKI
ncbi:NAD(+) diphosphatase [Maricaulis sp. CAU 1757]